MEVRDFSRLSLTFLLCLTVAARRALAEAEFCDKEDGATCTSSRKPATVNVDNVIRGILDECDQLARKTFFKDKLDEALKKLDKILEKYSQSPRANLARARVLDRLSEKRHSNALLEQSIESFGKVLTLDTPEELLYEALERYIDRSSFRGWIQQAIKPVQNLLSSRPQVGVRFRNQLGLAFLLAGKNAEARKTFEEAYQVYERGAKLGLFPSKYQRSLYNCKGLTARPFWTVSQTTYERHFEVIKKYWGEILEALSLLDPTTALFQSEDEKLTAKGDWKQFTLWQRGQKLKSNCARSPRTCDIVGKLRPAISCSRGQVKFSVMHPGTHVHPHCGPTNCRIRAHLGLVVPRGGNPRIRVANETRKWMEGEFIVFDDSFEHEVWFDEASSGPRLVLIVDFWHPELSEEQ